MRIFGMNSIGMIAAVCAASTLAPAKAQPKKGMPPTRDQQEAALRDQSLEQAGKDWRQAMEKLEDPKIIFSFEIEGGGRLGGGRTRSPKGFNPGSGSQSLIDDLEMQLTSYMNQAYSNTYIINAETMGEVWNRINARMIDAEQDARVDQVMRESDADLGVIGRFVPKQSGAYDVRMNIVDQRTGRRTPVGSYDIDLNDNQSTKTTSAAIFEELAKATLSITTRKSPRYDVVLFGNIGDKAIRGLPMDVSKINHVQNKTPIDMNKDKDIYTLRDIRYEGSSLDLGYEIADVLTAKYMVRARVEFNQGKIAIRVHGNTELPAWFELTSKERNPMQDKFRALYNENARPRFAVISAQSSRVSPANIAGMMMNAGVTVVDSSEAQGLIDTAGGLKPGINDEEFLAKLHGIRGFDVLVIGQASPNGGSTPGLSYRAIMVENGSVLGTQSWPSREAVADPDHRVDPLAPNPNDLARFISGGILHMYMRNHLTAGASIEVRVDAVSSSRQVEFIASSIESTVTGVISVSNVRYSGDVANFTLRYSGERSALMASLQESIDSLPIDTDIDSVGSGSIRMRAKPLDSDR